MIGFSGMALFDQLIKETMSTNLFDTKTKVFLRWHNSSIELTQGNKSTVIVQKISEEKSKKCEDAMNFVISSLNKRNDWHLVVTL